MTPGAFRLLLAFVVVVHHSFPLRLGAVAVGLFFVLSGYWISRMWREKYAPKQSPYLNFIVSRWWRLAPLFFGIHLLAALLILSGALAGNAETLANPWWWLTQPVIAGSTQVDRLLPPAWSLDVEMQFYLVTPLLVAAALRKAAGLGVIAGLMAWGTGRLIWTGASLETPHLDLYAWLFLLGVVCDQWRLRPNKMWRWGSGLLTFGIIAAVLAHPESRSWLWLRGSEGAQAPAVGPTLLFVALSLSAVPFAIGTVLRRSGSWDRWLGDLSYPLYLFHWLPREWYYLWVDWSQPAWRNGLLLLINWGISLLGAVVLLQAVDRPLQRLRPRVTDWLQKRRNRPDRSRRLESQR